MQYNKLVRDKIVDDILAKGEACKWHTATPEEYATKLKEKLLEEANELIESGDIKEFADVYEVLEALAEHHQFSKTQIEEAKKTKQEKRGGFTKKIILEES